MLYMKALEDADGRGGGGGGAKLFGGRPGPRLGGGGGGGGGGGSAGFTFIADATNVFPASVACTERSTYQEPTGGLGAVKSS